MDNILNSIKKLLGINPEFTEFDQDLMIHINSVFMILNQIGIGPKEGFALETGLERWEEYINKKNENAVRSYVFLKVKLLFDPPTSSALIESIRTSIAELEWRLYLEGGDNNE